MNWRAIMAIVRKDIKVVSQSKGVTIPLIIVPLLLFVGLPAMVGLIPLFENSTAELTSELEPLLSGMPAALRTEFSGLSQIQVVVVLALVYMMAPLYLIIPLMVANVIAADSFTGEKERKTLEALLYTPTTDMELFVAKLLTAWLPALAVSLLGFVVYGLVANLAAWPVMGRIFFPNWTWIILVFWVAPAAAGLGLASMVLVSSRVNSFQEAYQIGSIVVLPVLLLVIGQATGVMYLSPWLVAVLGLLFWAVDVGLLWLGTRTFQRGELIARL